VKVSSERFIRMEEQLKRQREKIEILIKSMERLQTKEFYLKLSLIILLVLVMGYKEAIKVGFLGTM